MGRHGKCFNAAFYTTLLIILILQLLSTLERQVFDFLGFMWAPIIANFFQLVCVIIGGFGAYQYRSKFIAVYSTWSLIWLGWNVFVICLYLEVGVLNRKRDLYILSIGTKNKSWWLENGIGCQITNTSWKLTNTVQDSSRDIPPEDVIKGCLLEYYYVEVIHAAVQCLLALIGFVFSCITLYMYGDEEESCKYLAQSSTYSRPTCVFINEDKYATTKYEPIPSRNSWCLPTYVSFTDSLDWSNPGHAKSVPNIHQSSTVLTTLSSDHTPVEVDGVVVRRQFSDSDARVICPGQGR
ncbi:sodium/potassium-transporting ATPase subunit beta-1-interacting protein 3-like isoform X5 [Mizuhopecten yessoensis]|uniref:sodium/potassium-transporting ATPase subunit beta-1-interacting protein 3-like isoform X5 n=1 Tax=Mizuhopecten yessoensis TaxID=6573 RepID=UPI000B458252|nr:sodium/potassium-transporting ATPase subunit beta-1-interacting protein 3-like isoform X5 [Mizuhopecten yessoensis]